MARDVRLALGGFDFRLSAEGLPLVHEADACYRSFLLPSPAAPPVVDTIHVRFEVSPDLSFEGRTIFEGTVNWSILARERERAFVFHVPAESRPAWIARFRPGSSEVLVACSPTELETTEGRAALRSGSFSYPLDQILAMYLLGDRGFVLHAAGTLVRGRGVAFAGVSGAGKSTLTGLAAGRPDWEPLSDDRLIVRAGGGGHQIWGTPWSGEGEVAEHRCGDLSWLLFLDQGRTNAVRRLAPAEALPRLLQTASLPWYDAECLEPALAACSRLVQAIPCAVLTFRPDAGAVQAVERLLEGLGAPTPSR